MVRKTMNEAHKRHVNYGRVEVVSFQKDTKKLYLERISLFDGRPICLYKSSLFCRQPRSTKQNASNLFPPCLSLYRPPTASFLTTCGAGCGEECSENIMDHEKMVVAVHWRPGEAKQETFVWDDGQVFHNGRFLPPSSTNLDSKSSICSSLIGCTQDAHHLPSHL